MNGTVYTRLFRVSLFPNSPKRTHPKTELSSIYTVHVTEVINEQLLAEYLHLLWHFLPQLAGILGCPELLPPISVKKSSVQGHSLAISCHFHLKIGGLTPEVLRL